MQCIARLCRAEAWSPPTAGCCGSSSRPRSASLHADLLTRRAEPDLLDCCCHRPAPSREYAHAKGELVQFADFVEGFAAAVDREALGDMPRVGLAHAALQRAARAVCEPRFSSAHCAPRRCARSVVPAAWALQCDRLPVDATAPSRRAASSSWTRLTRRRWYAALVWSSQLVTLAPDDRAPARSRVASTWPCFWACTAPFSICSAWTGALLSSPPPSRRCHRQCTRHASYR